MRSICLTCCSRAIQNRETVGHGTVRQTVMQRTDRVGAHLDRCCAGCDSDASHRSSLSSISVAMTHLSFTVDDFFFISGNNYFVLKSICAACSLLRVDLTHRSLDSKEEVVAAGSTRIPFCFRKEKKKNTRTRIQRKGQCHTSVKASASTMPDALVRASLRLRRQHDKKAMFFFLRR